MTSRGRLFSLAAALCMALGMLIGPEAEAATPSELAAQIVAASQDETDPAGAIQAAIDASGLEPADVAFALGLAQALGADNVLVADALAALQAAHPELVGAIVAAYNDGQDSSEATGSSPATTAGFQGDFSGVGGGQDNPSPN